MPLSRVRQFGVKWEFESGFQKTLERLLASEVTEIKKGALRSVHRVTLESGEYYLKRTFFRPGFFASALAFVTAARVRADWRLSRKLPGLGVPVAPALAYGERWDWRGLVETVLVTLGPPGFVPLRTLSDPPSADLQRKLGRFLRRVHDQGVGLRDLHTKNILCSLHDDRFCLIDLDTVCLGLSPRKRLDHLARLHSRWPLQPAFFEGYGDEYAPWKAQIAQRAACVRRRRCLKNNADFESRTCGGIHWHVRKSLWDGRLDGLLKAPEPFIKALESEGRATVLKRTPTSILVKLGGVVLKGYGLRPFPGFLKDLLRPARALRAYTKAFHLELAGINTARPIAAGSFRNRFRGWSYYVMEAIPEPSSLWSWRGERRHVTRRLATLLARLHESGFAHRDLKDTNILVDGSGNPHLVDMEGLRFAKSVSLEMALSNLARLGRTVGRIPRITGADKARFVVHYCRCRGWPNWRQVWDALEERVAQLPPPRLRSGGYVAAASNCRGANAWVPMQPGAKAFVRSAWEKDLHGADLRTLDDFFRVEGEPLSKPGLGKRYRARLRLKRKGTEARVYLKRFGGERFTDLVKRWFEDGTWHSAAEREVRVAEALARGGIRVPLPIAWGRSGAGTDLRSFVVFTEARGEPLSTWVSAKNGGNRVPSAAGWIDGLAEAARQLHSAGWRHRDFYLCHFFIEDGASPPRFTIIDLQRVFRPRFRPQRWRIKDLAQLHFSAKEAGIGRTPMLRFLLRYCAKARLDAETKALARAILRKSRRIRPPRSPANLWITD